MVSATTDFDFRRPSKLGREVTRSLGLAHETFARRVGTGWGSELRAYVQLDPTGISILPYDDVIRSMPSPHLLITAMAAPLPGAIVVEIDLQLGMLLVQRLLGGSDDGSFGSAARPSEVEVELLGHLGSHAVQALAEITAPLGGVDPRLVSVDVNPQLVQVAAPSDPTMLVSFSVRVSGTFEARGTLSVLYPGPVQTMLLEHMQAAREAGVSEHQIAEEDANGLLSGIGSADVDVAVRLHDSVVAAADVASLAVGDVLRLDHRVGRPAVAAVGDTAILDVHLGRLGPRRAAQVAEWRRDDDAPPVSQTLRALTRPATPALSGGASTDHDDLREDQP